MKINLDCKEKTMGKQIITGYPTLDKILGGDFRPGEVTVIAGWWGLDIFSLNIILNNLLRNRFDGKPTATIALFSVLELREDAVYRMVCIEAGYKMHSGTPSSSVQNRITNIIDELKETNLYLENAQQLSINEIADKAKSLKKHSGLDFIVIESFQNFVRRKPPYHPFGDIEDATQAAANIKQLAKELNVPILVSYFLHYPTRQGKIPDMCKPMLEAADNILNLIYDDTNNTLKLEVTKSSTGATGTINMRFEGWHKRITEFGEV